MTFALMTSACSAFADLQFVQDDSLTIVTPENLSTVQLPFEVSWALSAPTDQPYAVFIDRYPMPPGEDLRSIVDKDANCRGSDECLKADYLGPVFGIYVTSQGSVEIQSMPTRSTATGDSHFATIVPVDGEGNRVGEAVWFVSFQVNR